MFHLDDLKKLDPTRLDLTKLDLSKLDVRRMDLPQVTLPKFELPELPKVDVPFQLPKMELPKVDLPLDRLAALVRDAAYVGVGATVVTAKTADDRRRALTEQVTTQVRKLVATVA